MIKLSNARVFVTGAGGFLGSHLVRRLHAEGASLGLLLRPGGPTRSVDDVCRDAQTFFGTITDDASLKRIVDEFRPTVVIHLAAYTSGSRNFAHAEDALRTNLLGTINLLRALETSDVQSIVMSGTCEEYGNAEPPMHEDLPPRPISPYSASKAAMTSWCQMANRLIGLPICVVRPFLCYGPGQKLDRPLPQVVCAAIEGRDFAMTRGEQTRDPTHVTDVVDGIVRAATSPAASGEIINLGTGEEYRIRDIFEKIFEIAGGHGHLKVGALPDRVSEVWRSASSTEKAWRLLGWKPKISLDDGLVETVAWYRDHMSMIVKDA